MRVALPSDESIWTRPLGPPSDAELEEEALQIYIMSSSEDYHGGIAITDALAAHTVLVRIDLLRFKVGEIQSLHEIQLRIHSRIAVYLRDLTNKRLTTLQADQRFVALEASSRAVFGSLSPWLSPEYGRVYDNVSLTHRQPLPWISAHVGMFCHLNILLLYKSRVTLLAPGPRGQAFISALGKLQESAQFVTYVASLFLRDNPEFRNVGPYVCVPLYEAGLAWLKISRLSLTEAYRPQMDHNLVILIRALGFLSRRYVLAESLRDGLADMRMSRFSLAAATRRKR